MKTRFLIIVQTLFFVVAASAQECVYFYPHVEGATLVYQHYDKNDKTTGKLSQELTSFSTTAKGSKGDIISKMYDAEDNLVSEVELEMKCEKGIFYFDMMSYVNQESLKAYEDMEVTMDAKDVEFPSNLKVGDKLADADIKITVNTGIFPLTFSVSVTDREVEAKESITTAAGTFEAYKINQTTTAKFGLEFTTQSTEWYSRDVGMVKSVSYKNGKPESRSELVSLSR